MTYDKEALIARLLGRSAAPVKKERRKRKVKVEHFDYAAEDEAKTYEDKEQLTLQLRAAIERVRPGLQPNTSERGEFYAHLARRIGAPVARIYEAVNEKPHVRPDGRFRRPRLSIYHKLLKVLAEMPKDRRVVIPKPTLAEQKEALTGEVIAALTRLFPEGLKGAARFKLFNEIGAKIGMSNTSVYWCASPRMYTSKGKAVRPSVATYQKILAVLAEMQAKKNEKPRRVPMGITESQLKTATRVSA